MELLIELKGAMLVRSQESYMCVLKLSLKAKHFSSIFKFWLTVTAPGVKVLKQFKKATNIKKTAQLRM